VKTSRYLVRVACLAAGLALAAVAATCSTALAATTHATGTLADGATWIADVPDNWNGTLLIYSHGFGPLTAADAPDAASANALLARGYALAGSSYDPTGSWWALKSAVDDQFQTITAATTSALPHAPSRVIAVGSSMGGLISALEAERGAGHIDGALTTCGIVAGGVRLNNYQLDGEYVMSKLLATTPVQLVNFFPNFAAGIATGFQLQAIANQAQTTAQGRARLALAMAFLNATPDVAGQPAPPFFDADAVEAAQFSSMFGGGFPIIAFVNAARPWIEMSAGGNASWTKGENFALLLAQSPYAFNVARLYREAGLNLWADLSALNAGANIPADPSAIASLEQTSVPTGRLQVPELDLHTIHDPLVPVEMESTYAAVVRSAGANDLLRQAYVDRFGHCAFSASEIVAGVEAVNHRIDTGHWDSVAEPQKLEDFANGLGLDAAAFVRFQPFPLSGDNGPFSPTRNG
jgi:alpha-beta hydrolase superfamily lysophospholipase